MRQLTVFLLDAIIPLVFAVLLLTFPQWFTKRDLRAEDNKKLAGNLKKIGWLLMAASVAILIVDISRMVK